MELNSFAVHSGFGPENITPRGENATFLAAGIVNVCWKNKLLVLNSSARCINLF